MRFWYVFSSPAMQQDETSNETDSCSSGCGAMRSVQNTKEDYIGEDDADAVKPSSIKEAPKLTKNPLRQQDLLNTTVERGSTVVSSQTIFAIPNNTRNGVGANTRSVQSEQSRSRVCFAATATLQPLQSRATVTGAQNMNIPIRSHRWQCMLSDHRLLPSRVAGA